MAKKTSEVLLQEVVGQLRQLNRSSVRDQLREAEANKRAEALMNQGEVQEEQQSTIIDAGMDFQRRFLAGQAKTFTDKTLQEKGAKLEQQKDLNKLMKHHYEATLSMAKDMAKLASHGEKPGSLYVHDISVEKGIGEVLKQDALTIKEFEKLGETVGDGLSDAAHISRGAQGLISLPGKIDVDEDAYIKLANKAYAQWEKRKESDPTVWKEGWMWDNLEEMTRLGNLEDFMQGSKVKLPKDLIVERSGGIDDQYPEGLHSASVVDPNSPRGRGYHGEDVAQRFRIPAGTEIFHPRGLADTNEVVLQGFDFAEVETKDGSLYAHDAPLLDYLKLRDNELDRQRNNDLRSQIENRREGGGGMGQFGMLGAGAAGGPLGMEMLDAAEGGGFMGNMLKNIRRSPWMLAPLLLFSKVRTSLWAAGKLLFKPFTALGGMFKNKNMLRNPKMWGGMFAYGLLSYAAGEFDAAIAEGEDPLAEIDFENGEIPSDGNFFTNWNATKTLNTAVATYYGVKLVKGGLKTKVGQILQGMMRSAWGHLGRSTVGYWLFQAARAAGMLAVGTGAALISWPALLIMAATGVAWWQWDNLMGFLAEDEDELLKVTGVQPPHITHTSMSTPLANKWGYTSPGSTSYLYSGNAPYNDLIPISGDLSLLNGDGDGSKVLTAIDQRRISNDTSNIITNHFHSNETIPFGWTGKQGFAPYQGN